MDLKRISAESVPAALEKAKLYRLLNEPNQAESICRDILRDEPDHQEAVLTLLLSLSDQFDTNLIERVRVARELLARLGDAYQRRYYEGILFERRARAALQRGGAQAGPVAYEWMTRAMVSYEAAAELGESGNDDPLLRWNTCARVIRDHEELRPDLQDSLPELLE